MVQIIPGAAPSQGSFLKRCVKKEVDECIVDELSDGATMCGEYVPSAIIEDESEKHFFSQGPGQVGRMLTIEWLKDEAPNVRSDDPVVTPEGKTYKIKKGSVMDLDGCWCRAELSTCGAC